MSGFPRLHLISSRRYCHLERFPGVAACAAAGGVDAVHVREPGLAEEELLLLVLRTLDALAGTGCSLFVNTNVEVARVAGVEGVHLPERGADPEKVRQRLQQGALVGVSVHSAESAARAERDGADYVIAGHVYETGSKPGQSGRGLKFLEEIARAVSIPVIAIGGIAPGNVPDVMTAGAHGVAVLSGILSAGEPEVAAQHYAAALERDRREQR